MDAHHHCRGQRGHLYRIAQVQPQALDTVSHTHVERGNTAGICSIIGQSGNTLLYNGFDPTKAVSSWWHPRGRHSVCDPAHPLHALDFNRQFHERIPYMPAISNQFSGETIIV